MGLLHTLLRHTALAVTALALIAATGARTATSDGDVPTGPLPAPDLELTCEMDFCVVKASYVLPVRHDGHDVTFGWETRPAPGYPDNESDAVRRTWPSGIGQPDEGLRGYRYSVTDFVWHSDIRCDDAVKVVLTGDPIAPASASADKLIPERPDSAFCSAYGMRSTAA